MTNKVRSDVKNSFVILSSLDQFEQFFYLFEDWCFCRSLISALMKEFKKEWSFVQKMESLLYDFVLCFYFFPYWTAYSMRKLERSVNWITKHLLKLFQPTPNNCFFSALIKRDRTEKIRSEQNKRWSRLPPHTEI